MEQFSPVKLSPGISVSPMDVFKDTFFSATFVSIKSMSLLPLTLMILRAFNMSALLHSKDDLFAIVV